MSIADDLEKLANLRDKGLLSEEEFQAQKIKILNKPTAQAIEKPNEQENIKNNQSLKPCPKCGEQILAVAVRCKHCGNTLGVESKNLSVEQSVSIKVNTNGKSMVVAYFLLLFLGGFGVHRFYLGRVKSGFTQLLLCVFGWPLSSLLIGIPLLIVWGVWVLLDVYYTQKIVREENEKLGLENSVISVSKTGGIYNELDQLDKLHTLYEKGIITKEQYEERKSKFI